VYFKNPNNENVMCKSEQHNCESVNVATFNTRHAVKFTWNNCNKNIGKQTKT